MNFLGWELRRKDAQFEDVLRRIVAAQQGGIGAVTPETCMRSPTVHAIVTAISRRIAVSPVHVYEKTRSSGRDSKKQLPDHPVAKLLQAPNNWQTRISYWLDAASCFVRYGNFYAFKSRGSTGPIRELIPLHPTTIEPKQDSKTYKVTYKVTSGAEQREYEAQKIHHVRGPARDFLTGDSPVSDVKTSIALEIAAEDFGATFFDNGAMPLMIFKYIAGSAGFKTAEAEKAFTDEFQRQFSGGRRHRAMLLPKGMEEGKPIAVENDKAQMIESRRYQRTVIAGAFGVPPHLVGDLERATFNNVEQQDLDFTSNVVLPVIQSFEAAIERDLLTDEDRRAGIIVRFNLDSILRGDFKSRQEGLRVQRDAGVISPNEWREIEGKNPISAKKGGEDYLRPGNMLVAGEEPAEEPEEPKESGDDNAEADDPARN
jgi:HK97 family phage portal protein